jgi:putative phosphoribosyl transferase
MLVYSAAFADRTHAGQLLARKLMHYCGRPDVIVLGLPRGGVVVAFEVAKALGAPLEVFVVRKLGVPGQEELAMGAIASGGVRVLNDDVVRFLGISPEIIDAVTEKEARELQRREALYRGERPFPELKGRTVIIVDDGLATGATMRAAVAAVRAMGPARVVVAVPTASIQACQSLAQEADEVISVITPEPFYGVGLWYAEFPQTSDEEVRRLLREARSFAGAEGEKP